MSLSHLNKQNTVVGIFIAITVIIAALMTVISLYIRTEIAINNDENFLLNARIASLEEENVRLYVRLCLEYPLDYVENTAKAELGMLQEGSILADEIAVEKEDRAEIPEKENTDYSWISSICNRIIQNTNSKELP